MIRLSLCVALLCAFAILHWPSLATSEHPTDDKLLRRQNAPLHGDVHRLKRRQNAPADDSSSANTSPGTSSAGDANVTAVIDFMLSNWWNNTQYLAMSSPNVPFLKNVTYNSTSTNATSTTPLVVGIEVKERRQYQRMIGLGASITDAAAIVLQSLRVDHPDAYDEILNLAFNESPDWIKRGGAGMNMIRTPIGSSDFGFTQYSYDDPVDGSDDPNLELFTIDKSPKRWKTLQDILAINPNVIIMGSAWSPPAWMKTTRTSYAGGDILPQYEEVYCDYLIKFIQVVGSEKKIPIKYITLMNEPLYTSDVRPTTHMSPEQQARIGILCRNKMDAAGLEDVKILAYDHNWNQGDYATQVYDLAKEAFAGVAWHCYGGDPSQQDPFNKAFPDQEVMMTECTRISQYSQETWANLQAQFNTLITGSIDYGSQAIILWNMALQVDDEGFTIPIIPNNCLNCIAPFLIFKNSTQPNLEGANLTQIQQAQHSPPTSKREYFEQSMEYLLRRQQAQQEADATTSAKNVSPDQMNQGANNAGQIIPPFRANYYQTSDFVAMVHLGRAIRPAKAGAHRWAQRVGVVTTDDVLSGPRLKVQLFRNSLGNGRSRWSLIILQWYTHYAYAYAAFEDMTIQIKFRDSVATMIIPPGVFTVSWEADDSKYEHDGS